MLNCVAMNAEAVSAESTRQTLEIRLWDISTPVPCENSKVTSCSHVGRMNKQKARVAVYVIVERSEHS